MLNTKVTTAEQDSDARKALYSKNPQEKQALKVAKSLWKKLNSKSK
jgi:hypothetical protein